MSISSASIPVFEIGLNALSVILDKAEAHAEAKKIDPTVLLNARLSGLEPPKHEDNEKTFAELKARIAKALAYVKTLDAKAIDVATDRQVTFPLGPNNKGHMKGADFLNHFVLPNFYFHLKI